ncbi:MAG: hypothetical protein ACRDSM_20050 [Pseudonocardiaceae bacterium]
MRRRTLLVGFTSLADTAVFAAPSRRVAAGDVVGTVESALLDPPAVTGIPLALPDLRRAVTAARSVFQRGCYTEVATRLPELVSMAMATSAESDHQRGCRRGQRATRRDLHAGVRADGQARSRSSRLDYCGPSSAGRLRQR